VLEEKLNGIARDIEIEGLVRPFSRAQRRWREPDSRSWQTSSRDPGETAIREGNSARAVAESRSTVSARERHTALGAGRLLPHDADEIKVQQD